MHALLLKREFALVYEIIKNPIYFLGSEYRLKTVICEILSWVESSLEKKQYLVMRKYNNLCIDKIHRDKS